MHAGVVVRLRRVARRRAAAANRLGRPQGGPTPISRFPAENLLIAILSRPVPVCRLSSRLLHNLLHSAVDSLAPADLGLIDAYDAYILEAARSSGFPLLALDGPYPVETKNLGLSLVELDL